DQAVLKVTGASSYIWQGPQGYYSASPNASIQSARNVMMETYSVMGTAVNGCTAISTATLKTIPLPIPSLSADPSLKQCLNETIQLTGNGGTAYEWRGPGKFYYPGKNLSLQLSSPDMAGIYTLTVFDINSCREFTTAKIMIDPLPAGEVEIE